MVRTNRDGLLAAVSATAEPARRMHRHRPADDRAAGNLSVGERAFLCAGAYCTAAAHLLLCGGTIVCVLGGGSSASGYVSGDYIAAIRIHLPEIDQAGVLRTMHDLLACGDCVPADMGHLFCTEQKICPKRIHCSAQTTHDCAGGDTAIL